MAKNKFKKLVISNLFKNNDEAIKVRGMTVKKYRKHTRRDFLIKIDEKNRLAEDLISFASSCDTDFLFPRMAPFTGEPISDEHTSRVRIYLLVREISHDLWCHWFRAQRASFNVFVRDMNIFDLHEWFEWKSIERPAHYINQTLDEMAKQMGIRNISA